ncbi:MAG: hypothetical protein ACP5LI_07740 [Hydrogenobaculum sp.]
MENQNNNAEIRTVEARALFMPTLKVVIHNMIEIKKEDIVSLSIPVLYWCKGYVLIMNALPFTTSSVAQAFMNGELHISDLFYVKMDYTPELEIGYAKIKVIDVSSSVVHTQIVGLIKKLEEVKTSQQNEVVK